MDWLGTSVLGCTNGGKETPPREVRHRRATELLRRRSNLPRHLRRPFVADKGGEFSMRERQRFLVQKKRKPLLPKWWHFLPSFSSFFFHFPFSFSKETAIMGSSSDHKKNKVKQTLRPTLWASLDFIFSMKESFMNFFIFSLKHGITRVKPCKTSKNPVKPSKTWCCSIKLEQPK